MMDKKSNACRKIGMKNNCYRILVGRSEGKRPLEILRCKCENNIKMNLKAIRWNIVDWVCLTQGNDKWQSVVKTVMKLLVT